MSDPTGDAGQPKPTIFLSYASEDRHVAQAIGETLVSQGLEVWLDQSELGGGDVWDQKIRRQIRECDYFMALVSAQTESRHEGYFRREWRLAVERTLDMADDHLFLLPVVIDETPEATARVPEKFLSVQWLKLPAGQSTAAFETLCRRLTTGTVAPSPPRRSHTRPIGPQSLPAAAAVAATDDAGAPEPPAVQPPAERPFPKEQEGEKVRFWFEVVGWVFASAWAGFKRWPRWVRYAVILWGVIWLFSESGSNHSESSRHLSSSDEEKLKRIAQQYQGGASKTDLTKLATAVAHEFADSDDESAASKIPILAIPFGSNRSDSTPAQQVADNTFAQIYGRLAIARHGKVGLAAQAQPACETSAVVAEAKEKQSTYALCGFIDTHDAANPTLNIRIADIEKESVLWEKAYPAAGADPEKIAAEVSAKMPSLDDE